MMLPEDAAFADLTRKISREAGLSLDAYKDKCLRRRIAVRMRACGVHTYADYQAVLDRSPAEYQRLKDAITINVTRFYRNAETWNLIRDNLLREICDPDGGEVRAWSAGCSSGEEPYTLAVLIADYLDRHGHSDRLGLVTVDATRMFLPIWWTDTSSRTGPDTGSSSACASGSSSGRWISVTSLRLGSTTGSYCVATWSSTLGGPRRNGSSSPLPTRWRRVEFWCWARWRLCSAPRASVLPCSIRASGSTGGPHECARSNRQSG
jgi:hypothetical protein